MAASSTSGSPEIKRARLNSDNTMQTQRNDTNSGSSNDLGRTAVNLPCMISDWTERDLQHLSIKITYEENLNPMTLIEPFLPSHTSHVLDDIEKFFTDYCAFHRYILNDEFSCISRTVARDLCSKTFYETSKFTNSNFFKELSSSKQNNLKCWFERVSGCGVKFGKTLYNMILKRDLYVAPPGGMESLCKYDFQFLFDSFASIFGLQSGYWFDPVVLPNTLTLSEADISGQADILYCEDIEDVSEKACKLQDIMNIVAVCEVRQDSCDQVEALRSESSSTGGSRPSYMSPSNSQGHTSSSNSNRPPHISSSLLGQHGGKLLLYRKQSVLRHKDVIMGIIVQNTKVSFTALKMTEDEYDCIKTGKQKSSSPELFITKAYDFLRKDDRTHLIRPLTGLALLQSVT